jgi:AraC-like DNA-binding protein
VRLQTLIHRIEVHPGTIILKLRPQRLAEIVDPDVDPTIAPAASIDRDVITLTIPATLKRSGMAMTLTIDGATRVRAPDRGLLRLFTLAERYSESVLRGQGKSIKDLAAEAGVGSSYFTRIFRLGFLAPDITKAILQGRQPENLTAKHLSTKIKISLSWTEQRKQLGFI